MNEQCIQCDKPRHPRSDRPGKFHSRCHEHYKEYQREKNRESYYRHQDKRVQYSRDYRAANPEKTKEYWQRYYADPEKREQKQAYMEVYMRPWRRFLKPACERCGFVAVERKQLDVHHKDGDRSNNDPSNLETLCPPCHRLVPITP